MRPLQRIALIALALAATACSGPESPGNKSEWSVLQGVEYEHRGKPVQAPLVLNVSRHRVVGLPRTDAPGLIWVLLTPEHDPLYKQLPEGQFTLTSAQLAELSVSEPTVLAKLQAHVRE